MKPFFFSIGWLVCLFLCSASDAIQIAESRGEHALSVTLTASRLTLRSINTASSQDLYSLRAILSQDVNMRYFTRDGRGMQAAFIQDLIEEGQEIFNSGCPFSLYTIHRNDNEQLIGFVGATEEQDNRLGWVNFSMVIDQPSQRQGFGGEATDAIVTYMRQLAQSGISASRWSSWSNMVLGFIQDSGFRGLETHVDVDNHASHRLLTGEKRVGQFVTDGDTVMVNGHRARYYRLDLLK